MPKKIENLIFIHQNPSLIKKDTFFHIDLCINIQTWIQYQHRHIYTYICIYILYDIVMTKFNNQHRGVEATEL